jgi:hypothetical protein
LGLIKKFNKVRNGRAVVLALKTQAKGQSAKLTRKTKAYASISSTTFCSQRHGFNFDNYISSIHLDGHNELLDLDVVSDDGLTAAPLYNTYPDTSCIHSLLSQMIFG